MEDCVRKLYFNGVWYEKTFNVFEDVEKVCEEAKANKTDDQEVTCEKHVTITNPSKTTTFDSLKSLMEKECQEGSIMNDIDMTDPDKAPENVNGRALCKAILTWIPGLKNLCDEF